MTTKLLKHRKSWRGICGSIATAAIGLLAYLRGAAEAHTLPGDLQSLWRNWLVPSMHAILNLHPGWWFIAALAIFAFTVIADRFWDRWFPHIEAAAPVALCKTPTVALAMMLDDSLGLIKRAISEGNHSEALVFARNDVEVAIPVYLKRAFGKREHDGFVSAVKLAREAHASDEDRELFAFYAGAQHLQGLMAVENEKTLNRTVAAAKAASRPPVG